MSAAPSAEIPEELRRRIELLIERALPPREDRRAGASDAG